MRATKSKIKDILDTLDSRLKQHGNAWVPQHPRLLGVPQIQSGEAFSSWVLRVSMQSKIPLKKLLQILSVKSPTFQVDCGAEKVDFDAIARLTMLSPKLFRGFQAVYEQLACEQEFTCLTTEPLFMRPIYRYCSDCLITDSTPFFRQMWRYSFCYLCPEHRNILRDNCPHCNCRIDLNIINCSSNMRKSLRFCMNCGQDLCHGKSQWLPELVYLKLLFQQKKLFQTIGYKNQMLDHRIRISACNQFDIGQTQMRTINHLTYQIMRIGDFTNNHLFPVEQRRKDLRKYLHKIKFVRNKEEITLAYAMDGHALFGADANVLGSYFIRIQNLSAGTIWWPKNVGISFSDINNFSIKKCLRADRWVKG